MSMRIFTLLMLTFILSTARMAGQDIILEPLFEYPEAPGELPDLESKSNYLVSNFWRQFDFDVSSVGQLQLNHAFHVYASAMPWANKPVVDDSVDHLIDKVKKKPGLLYQFCVAAEDALHGKNAEFWIDDVYLKFLDALSKNRKIAATSGAGRMLCHRMPLVNSQIGGDFPGLVVKGSDAMEHEFTPSAGLSLIVAGSLSDSECRMARLRLDTDFALQKYISDKLLSVWLIVPERQDMSDEDMELSLCPASWVSGSCMGLEESLDLRMTPALYLVDNGGKILAKNIDVDNMVKRIKSILEK